MCDVAINPTKPTSGSPCNIKALLGTDLFSTTLTGSDKQHHSSPPKILEDKEKRIVVKLIFYILMANFIEE